MKEWITSHRKHVEYLLICIMGICFAVTRFWQLDKLPAGMHLDEAGMAYDALSLANYGVDRYLKSWPVYLTNFGVGQSSLYAFLCAGLFKLFGYSIWLVRLPGVLFSFLTMVFGIKIAKRIWPGKKVMPLLAGAMVTFCPYFIMGSRFGLDCNLMLGASTVFLYFLLTAFETGDTWRYVVSGITGGILLYTYVLSYIILPLFLIFCLFYVIAARRFSLKKWICMAIPMGVLAFPLILVQLVNLFQWEEMQIGPFTITRLPWYRASEIGWFQWKYFVSAIKHVFVGDDYLFDSIPGIWNLYAITVILFVIGMVSAFERLFRAVRKREFSSLALPLLWFLAELFFESHIKTSTYTINGIFLVTALLAVEGIHVLCRKAAKWKPLLLLGICGIYALCFLRFGVFYYSGEYTEKTYPLHYFGITFSEGIDFIEGDEVLREKLTFVSEVGIFYALSKQLPPDEFGLSGDQSIHWNQYWFGSLQEISDEYNYLMCDGYEDYREELRQAGFSEQRYDNYSVFYKK